jgi:hypothetical protein
MAYLKQYIRKIFPDKRTTAASAIVGISTGLAIYLGKLQRHFFSKSYFVYAVLISVLATILVAWLRQCCLRSKFLSLSRKMRTISLIFTVLIALILLANVQIQPLYYILPDSDLQIRIPIGDVPEGHEGVRLLWVETGQGYVHYTHMDYAGKWERVFGNTVFEPNQDMTITWSGKVGPVAEIAFRMTPFDQPVFVSWNGEEVEYNLNNPKEPNIFIRTAMDIPIWYKLPFILSFTISIGFLVFALLILLATWQPRRGTKRPSGKYTWLLYMLPMVLVWGFSLLVFWPGIMSNDSVTLWSQNLVGEYSDWQSAFYALMLAALMKIWYSPALIVILQMLTLAFLTAWGLKAFEDRGVPRLYLWMISLLFAILPINNLFIITLWRDIPYAIAIFWMTIIILKIYFSQGAWLKGLGWLWLALSGFLIAILRQNGIPVAFVVLALLPVVYRKYWKRLSASLLLCAALLLLMKGPVFDWLSVDRSKTGQSNLILAHHIAAHLDAGTPLKTDEEQYLNEFMPVDDWYYYCCYVGTVSYDSDFAREEFLNSSAENRKLVLDLFLRDPLVDVRHMLCSGEMVWKYMNNQCIMKSVHGFNSWAPGETSWIIPNDAGLKEDSRIPALVQPYIDMLGVFGFRDDFLMIYLRPALYMYLSAILILVFSLRSRNFRPFLVVMPVLVQAAILFLISYAPAIRYQYSNYMVGLYLLGLLFLPGGRMKEDEA